MNDCPICGSKIPTDLLGEPQLKPGQEFIRTYCDAFKARYGTNPQIIGVDAGIAKRLVKDLGLPKAKALVETYLGMTDAWFLERRHDLKTFANNLQKIVVALETGYNPSKKETNAMERRGTNINAFKRLLDESEP
jgi:hypothetical protein